MPMIPSHETIIEQNPKKFAVNPSSKLLTKVSEPPAIMTKGRRRNPVVTNIYNELVMNRGQWFHVNIPLTSKTQVASLRTSLYSRAKKDNLATETRSLFNETTKMFDFWVKLTNA